MPRRPDIGARIELVRANSDVIRIAAIRAAANGVAHEDAVVLLLDTRDPVGRDLAVALVERA